MTDQKAQLETDHGKPATSCRFVIGIDLGTSNCAMSYIDTYHKNPACENVSIMQWEDDDQMVSHQSLPSFLYLATKSEVKKKKFCLPWEKENDESPFLSFVIGRAARNFSLSKTHRVVHSAKSWLCHGGVNRQAKILPWHSEEIIGSDRLAPVEASAQFLGYLAKWWDYHIAPSFDGGRFCDQQITITVPASFDEIAQSLTLQAAFQAGYPPSTRLLEEPQAAFYDWAYGPSGDWQDKVFSLLAQMSKNQADVLVCDIGGGTSDFSILRIRKNQTSSTSAEKLALSIERLLVSDHLLLGGDNIDLSIAHYLDQQRRKSSNEELDATAWSSLVSQSRALKERILNDLDTIKSEKTDLYHVTWQSPQALGASSLFTGSHSLSISSTQLKDLILTGFFPLCAAEEKASNKRQKGPLTGLSEWNLPYATDSAITHHLAEFLSRHSQNIDAILYAGGTMNPKFLRDRLTSEVSKWQNQEPIVIETEDLSQAIARGAASYTYLQPRYQKQLIETYPRSVYLEVQGENQKHLIKIIDKNSAFGQSFDIEGRLFEALINQKVEISIYTSAFEKEALAIGDSVGLEDSNKLLTGLQTLPPMQTYLEIDPKAWIYGEIPQKLLVQLHAEVTATGLLALSCRSKNNPDVRWDFHFRLDDKAHWTSSPTITNHANPPALSHPRDRLANAKEHIENTFGKRKIKKISESTGDLTKPQLITSELEKLFGSKEQWELSLTRELWDALASGMNRRNRSEEHERSWLYLSGFCLRPGYGASLDQQRVEKLWKIFQQGPAFSQSISNQEQWWIMWRRVAGGLNSTQQTVILDKIMPTLRKTSIDGQELIRLAGALERADMKKRIQLANLLCKQICSGQKNALDARIWALARLLSRLPLYSGPEIVIRPGFVKGYFEELLNLDLRSKHYRRIATVFLQGGRIIDSRDFDIDSVTREKACNAMLKAGQSKEKCAPLKTYIPPDEQTFQELFGEPLPAGFKLLNHSSEIPLT